jgi:hypothetical protein
VKAFVLRDQARLKRALAIRGTSIDNAPSSVGLGARAIAVIGRILGLDAPGRVVQVMGELAA